MSHVDEGMLHAYLDGALEEYPTSEARRVRDHLDSCAACRERLAVERGIRDEAASILGLAAPHVEIPTLEELRAFARADTARRSPIGGRLSGLGWAASLVLALGAGWMLRGGRAGVPVEPPAPEVRQEAAAGSREEAAVDPVVIAEATQPVPEGAPSVTRPPTPEVVAIAIDAPAADVTRDSSFLDALDPVDPGPPALPEPEAIVAAALDRQSAEPVAVTNPEDARGDTSSARRAAPGEVVTSASVSAPAAGLVLGRNASDTRDAARSEDDGYSLVVLGLPVLDIRFRGSGTQPEGQVAVQQLESGDTLRVIHLPLDLDPTVLEERAPETNELVVRRSSGWIIMRARLSDAQLMELMTRLLSGS